MAGAERRARDAERRKQQILDCAVALLGEADWSAVTLEALGARAEIGKGTLYKHIPGKEALGGLLGLLALERVAHAVQALPADGDWHARWQAYTTALAEGEHAVPQAPPCCSATAPRRPCARPGRKPCATG